MDETERGLGDKGGFVVEHTAECESRPDGVASIHEVELGMAQEADDAKFDDEIVDNLL